MSLEEIRQEITNHSTNAWAKKLGYEPIYTASKKSRIVIIGQAPGRKAQESQIPWNDISGENLRAWLSLTREEFYNPDIAALVPMDFYFPGSAKHGDNPPRKEFAGMWHPKLFEHMPDIKLTILVGQYAQKYYLGKSMKKNLTETVRSYEEFLPNFLPLVHPSPLNFRWRSKNPWFEESVTPEAEKLVRSIIDQ